MMNKKAWISVFVVFVLSLVFGYLVHVLLLGHAYQEIPGLFRTPEVQAAYFPYMLLAHLFLSYAFVGIYLQGKEDKPFLAQGLCYGAYVATLVPIPWYLIYYAVQPIPGGIVIHQILFDTLGVLILGIVVAWIHR